MSFICDRDNLEWNFKSGRFSIEHEDLSGRPVPGLTPVNINATHNITSEWRIGLEQRTEARNILFKSAHHIVHVDLEKKKVSAKLIPNCLIVD